MKIEKHQKHTIKNKHKTLKPHKNKQTIKNFNEIETTYKNKQTNKQTHEHLENKQYQSNKRK